jgi:thioredoxin 2
MGSVVTCANCGARNRVDDAAPPERLPVCGRCRSPLAAQSAQSRAHETRPFAVTDQTFEREVLGAGAVPVLVDFWAAWCGPCRMIAPVLDELAAESRGRYRVAKLDVDANPLTASRFQVQSIPTLIIFKDGRPAERLVGLQPKHSIAARIKAVTGEP